MSFTKNFVIVIFLFCPMERLLFSKSFLFVKINKFIFKEIGIVLHGIALILLRLLRKASNSVVFLIWKRILWELNDKAVFIWRKGSIHVFGVIYVKRVNTIDQWMIPSIVFLILKEISNFKNILSIPFFKE